MSEIIVYHGGTEKVELPICKFGRRNLDFGQGFYITDISDSIPCAESMDSNRQGRPDKKDYPQAHMLCV